MINSGRRQYIQIDTKKLEKKKHIIRNTLRNKLKKINIRDQSYNQYEIYGYKDLLFPILTSTLLIVIQGNQAIYIRWLWYKTF